MPIIAKDTGGEFTSAPEGSYSAVCCDVIDRGIVENAFGKRHAVQFRWQLGEDAGLREEDGKPWLILKTYTLSLNEKATLRHDLESWRGKKFTSEELKGFDLEKVIGVPCLLLVLHNMADNGKTYANVNAIMPLPKGVTRPAIRDYSRVEAEYRPDEADHEEMPF